MQCLSGRLALRTLTLQSNKLYIVCRNKPILAYRISRWSTGVCIVRGGGVNPRRNEIEPNNLKIIRFDFILPGVFDPQSLLYRLLWSDRPMICHHLARSITLVKHACFHNNMPMSIRPFCAEVGLSHYLGGLCHS